MIIKLSDSEIMSCVINGSIRKLTNLSIGRGQGTLSGKDAMSKVQSDIDGFIGEYAFSKRFNLHMNMDQLPRIGSYDFICRKGRLDIKTCRFISKDQRIRLIVPLKYNDEVDVYILAIIKGNEVHFAGWTYKESIIKKELIDEKLPQPGYAMNQDQLNKWKL